MTDSEDKAATVTTPSMPISTDESGQVLTTQVFMSPYSLLLTSLPGSDGL